MNFFKSVKGHLRGKGGGELTRLSTVIVCRNALQNVLGCRDTGRCGIFYSTAQDFQLTANVMRAVGSGNHHPPWMARGGLTSNNGLEQGPFVAPINTNTFLQVRTRRRVF